MIKSIFMELQGIPQSNYGAVFENHGDEVSVVRSLGLRNQDSYGALRVRQDEPLETDTFFIDKKVFI